MDVLYEDNHLLIINKLAGILVQSDATKDLTIVEQAKKFIKVRDNKPSNVFLGLPHRLDRPTSGVLILCKTSKSLERMAKMFKTREIRKIYWAVVENPPPKSSGSLEHYLKKNQKNNKVTVYKQPTEGAKQAILEYQHIKSLNNYHLLEIELHTGRTHQIRAQLSNIGCCIKGDLKYGAKRSNPDKSISLLARKVSFEHPVTKQPLQVVAPPPKDALWQACLD